MLKIIWSRLPGGLILKSLQTLILIAILAIICHFWLFPAISAYISQPEI
ncbi:MAG: hypothetical protein Q618_VCMC00003G0135 [Varibaculum cambriense DORA_20]|nr:hypothetical protein [Varibaculum cambriense]ETI81833.1 MAG: hypothetical protein Q618_VCMC00003G0135 [Varibaculum cambriense DORA_20]